MQHVEEIQHWVSKGMKEVFDHAVRPEEVLINQTRKEFEGDYTVVIFPFVKVLRKSPKDIGDALGSYLMEHGKIIHAFNVVQGFVNLSLTTEFWINRLKKLQSNDTFGTFPKTGQKVMVEFSSPNTNKPLHLGHVRNILLGWSTSQILEAAGYDVIKTQIINDRGIAICKSMLAWKLFGQGQTPESTGIKSDLFVGNYYVLFEQKFKEEYATWQQSKDGQNQYVSEGKPNESIDDFFKRYKNTYFNEYSVLGNQAKDMLLAWEAEDPQIRQLWSMMNEWVYDGFEETYQDLGVSFDRLYYESDTYLLGKSAVEKGIQSGDFYQENDGSVWIDLEDVGMDKKILLRSDGTSVYMTQDIGTAQKRYADFGIDSMVYVVADEQDYHFKVLFEILKRIGEPYANALHHLSYGMVELPTGKMKSREGTVVDADMIVEEVIDEARKASAERGAINELTQEEQDEILRRIGLAAIKFLILKVQPKKRMIFDPKESVDMQGQTGPYVQNAFVRIQSVLRRGKDLNLSNFSGYQDINEFELELLKEVENFPSVVNEAAKQYDPSNVANYCYLLAKTYHRFYHEVRILNGETPDAIAFRVALSDVVSSVLSKGMKLLGIEMPDRM